MVPKIEIFERFFSGLTSAEENEALAEMVSSGDEALFDEYCRKYWKSVSADMDVALSAVMRKRIMAHIAYSDAMQRRTIWKKRIRKIAACLSVAAILVFGIVAGWHIAQNREPDVFKVVAERGYKSSLTLPDGSRVWLNSASTISYTSDYNLQDRDVFLQGEAFFEVKSGCDHPFIVHVKDVSVTAVGTSFNVRSYYEDDMVLTTLLEGKVLTEAGGNVMELYPYQEALYDNVTGNITKMRVKDENHAVPWMKNEILFENESLADIAVVLERMYNINVVFSDESVKDYSYTGLIRNNSLQNVLQLISSTSPVGYRMTSDTIKFFLK